MPIGEPESKILNEITNHLRDSSPLGVKDRRTRIRRINYLRTSLWIPMDLIHRNRPQNSLNNWMMFMSRLHYIRFGSSVDLLTFLMALNTYLPYPSWFSLTLSKARYTKEFRIQLAVWKSEPTSSLSPRSHILLIYFPSPFQSEEHQSSKVPTRIMQDITHIASSTA